MEAALFTGAVALLLGYYVTVTNHLVSPAPGQLDSGLKSALALLLLYKPVYVVLANQDHPAVRCNSRADIYPTLADPQALLCAPVLGVALWGSPAADKASSPNNSAACARLC